MAGAPGFEPGIAGPKPAALPLGYAPPPSSIGIAATDHFAAIRTAAPAKPAQPPSGIASAAAALGYAPPPSSIGTAATDHFAAIRTAAPAKPAQPPSGVASAAAALGYAPPFEDRNGANLTRVRLDYSVRSWCSRSVKR